MSQQAASYPPYVMVPVRESNGLGVAGFFIALIGLFIPTGIIALLGLLISLAALGRPPRGFAAMGVVIGLFGTVLWLVITGVVVLGGLAAGVVAILAVAAMFIMTQPEIIEVTSDMFNVTIAAVEYEERTGDLPEDLGALGLAVSTLTDPWGNPYSYRLANQDPGFDVMSNGADGIVGTDDDMALSRINVIWEDAFDGFGVKMEEFGQRME
ncbi:MAG: type II secretion system protein GspG, partial [Planctomycetota bacterium]